jgi:hypothetical protein
MKISREALAYGKTVEFSSIKEAIIDAATPNWSDDGQLEGLQSEIKELRELVARLVDAKFDKTECSKADELKYILGYSYEVEE